MIRKYYDRLLDIYGKEGVFAIVMLFIMGTQFIVWEGFAISTVKVVFMCFVSLLWITKYPTPSKAVALGFLFILGTLFIAYTFHPSVKMSSILYTVLFFITFAVYYNLVWIRHVFDIDTAFDLIKGCIYAYAGCFVLQQLFVLAGIRVFAPLNLGPVGYYSVTHLNSLAIEPSHAARILTVLLYAYIKCIEYSTGRPPKLKELFTAYRYPLFAGLYTMVFMGSGTAFVGLGILSLYFVKKQYIPLLITVACVFYNVSFSIDYEPLNRAIDTLNAAMTGYTQEVVKADHSASSRVNIILDTFTKVDLSSMETWIGHGVGSYNETNSVSAIFDYGMVSYILKLCFFFGCCFTSIFSLETIMFILLFGLNIGNIAYGWFALMILTTVKYLKVNYAS